MTYCKCSNFLYMLKTFFSTNTCKNAINLLMLYLTNTEKTFLFFFTNIFYFFSHYQVAATVPYHPKPQVYTPLVSSACIQDTRRIGPLHYSSQTPYRKWHRDNMLAGYHKYSTQFYADTRPSTKPLKYPCLRYY
jgi:hypothetical protein